MWMEKETDGPGPVRATPAVTAALAISSAATPAPGRLYRGPLLELAAGLLIFPELIWPIKNLSALQPLRAPTTSPTRPTGPRTSSYRKGTPNPTLNRKPLATQTQTADRNQHK